MALVTCVWTFNILSYTRFAQLTIKWTLLESQYFSERIVIEAGAEMLLAFEFHEDEAIVA